MKAPLYECISTKDYCVFTAVWAKIPKGFGQAESFVQAGLGDQALSLLRPEDWLWGLIAMKAVLFLCILGISAINSVAQTDPASASLPATPSISALTNGTANLEGGAPVRGPASIPDAPSASLPQFTVKLAFAEDPDQPFSTSQTALYDFWVDTGTPAETAGDLPHAEDSSSSKTLALQPVEPPHHGHESSLGKGQWGSPAIDRDHAHVQPVDRGGHA